MCNKVCTYYNVIFEILGNAKLSCPWCLQAYGKELRSSTALFVEGGRRQENLVHS